VTAIWQTTRSGVTAGVSTSRRPAGEGWSAPIHLSQDQPVTHPFSETFGAQHLNLAVGPGGAVLATWAWGTDYDGPQLRVQAAYRPRAGHWSKVATLTPANNSSFPLAGLDARGDAVLVYTTQPRGHSPILRSRRYAVGSGWTQATTVAPVAWETAMAVNPGGGCVVLFTTDRGRLWTRYRPAQGGWRPSHALSPTGMEVDDVFLAMNGRGAASAVYSDGSQIDVIRRPPLGPWTASERVGGGAYPVVALNRSGDTFAAWGLYEFHGRYRPHGGAWAAVSMIENDVGDVVSDRAAVVAPNGDVVVVWVREEPKLYARVMTAEPSADQSRPFPGPVGYRGSAHRPVTVGSPCMYLESATRPWGSWHVLDEGPGFKVKRIHVDPGQRLSYQTHAFRAEHWYVVAGTASCVIDGQTSVVRCGGTVDVPLGAAHRLMNMHEDELVVIEVQRGDYTGEDDICRLEDDYGRDVPAE
jgi:mannose-6-phosphate isomerase